MDCKDCIISKRKVNWDGVMCYSCSLGFTPDICLPFRKDFEMEWLERDIRKERENWDCTKCGHYYSCPYCMELIRSDYCHYLSSYSLFIFRRHIDYFMLKIFGDVYKRALEKREKLTRHWLFTYGEWKPPTKKILKEVS